MRIKCWGTRGSIPVSGRQYVKYGGNTTCFEVTTNKGEIVIIDSGSGIRELGIKILKGTYNSLNLLLTHAHWDHIMGFPFFKPIYIEGLDINIYSCPFTNESIRDMLAKTMTKPHFPVNFDDVRANFHYYDICRQNFSIGLVDIDSINLSHPNQGLSFKLMEEGKTFVFMTDNELTFKHEGGLDYKEYLEFVRGADVFMHDAEYTKEDYLIKKMWGHTIYTDALMMAIEAGVKQFGLIHHNQERSDEDIDFFVDDCRRIIKEHGSNLECFAVYEGMELSV